MSTYTGENVKDFSITTPTESSTPPSEVNDAIREVKDVIKNQWATIVKSTAYTLTPQDSLVLVSGTTTITIPASTDVSSSTFFKEYTIIKTDAAGANVTIARTDSDTFNGATSITLTKQYETAKIFGSGVADWKYLPINDLVAGTDYLTPTGDGSGLTGITTSDTITNLTTDPTTITAAQCTGRTTITNAGMGATSVEADLPAGAANRIIHFNHVDSGDLVIDPNGTEQLVVNGTALGAGTALTSTKQGSRFTLIWDSSGSKWIVHYSNTNNIVETVMSSNVSTTIVYGSYENITGCAVTIKCGISGKIKLNFSASVKASVVSGQAFFKITNGLTRQIGYATGGAVNMAYDFGYHTTVTGLTPGTSYTFQMQWATGSGETVSCNAATAGEYFMVLTAETE